MPLSSPIPTRRALLVLLPLLGACASMPRGAGGSDDPAPQQVAMIDSANRSADVEEGDTPQIRLTTLGGISDWVDASFRVSDDAYVMVIAVDLDGEIQVLHPQSSDEEPLATAHASHRITRFFAGFGNSFPSASYASFASFGSQSRYDARRGTGVIVGIASARPLQLDRVTDADGDWDLEAIRRIVLDRSAPFAASALGRALTLTGQSFSSDNHGFANNGMSSFASSFGSCNRSYSGLGYFAGWSDQQGFGQAMPVRFVADGVRYVRIPVFDTCNRVAGYRVVAVGPATMAPHDTTRVDSSAAATRRGPTARLETRGTTVRMMEGPDVVAPAGRLRFRSPEQLKRTERTSGSRVMDGSLRPVSPRAPRTPADGVNRPVAPRPNVPTERTDRPVRAAEPPRTAQPSAREPRQERQPESRPAPRPEPSTRAKGAERSPNP